MIGDNRFMFIEHKNQFYTGYNMGKDEKEKRRLLKKWKSEYLRYLYVAESDRIVLKFYKSDETVRKAFSLYSDQIPSLQRICELIEYWEQV